MLPSVDILILAELHILTLQKSIFLLNIPTIQASMKNNKARPEILCIHLLSYHLSAHRARHGRET